MTAEVATTNESHKVLRVELRAFIELFALCGIAVVQPLLDALAKNAGLFVAERATATQTIVLVLLIVFVPAFAVWVIEASIARVLPRSRRVLHALLIAFIVGVIAVEVLKKSTDLGTLSLVLISVVVGAVGALLTLFIRSVRVYLGYLAFAVPIFSLLFLAASPVTPVVFGGRVAAVADVKVSSPHRVVLVVMDELPEMSLLDGSGRFDAALYPNFAALAKTSTFYRNDTTVASFTSFAVPAILTGRFPKRSSDLPDPSSYPQNLFTLLGGTYEMNVHETLTGLCPTNLCAKSSSPGGIGGLVSQSSELWRQLASPARKKANPFSGSLCDVENSPVKIANQFVRSLKPTRGPELDFVHIVLPHQPWHLLGSLQDTGCFRGPAPLVWSDRDPSTRQRHLLQAQAADTLLGRITAKLKRIGAFDDSLVIVTADHGVAFTDGAPLRGVRAANYPEIMWTPLLVKYPAESKARVDDRPAESIDILPTVADVLGAQTPWALDGRSLRGPQRQEGERRVYNWGGSGLDLPLETTPPPGRPYLQFDGNRGFAAVLEARAASAGGDPALRIYRSVEFGSLVGRQAAPLVVRHDPTAVVSGVGRPFEAVNPAAPYAPWAYGEGTVSGLGDEHDVAVALNGQIVAVAHLAPTGRGRASFAYIVPPVLTKPGRNDMTVYLVGGTPSHPTLDSVRVTP